MAIGCRLEAAETGQAAAEARDIRPSTLAHPVAAAGPACIAPSISGGSSIRRPLSPLRQRKVFAWIDVCRAADVLNANLTVGLGRYPAFINADTLATGHSPAFRKGCARQPDRDPRQRVIF